MQRGIVLITALACLVAGLSVGIDAKKVPLRSHYVVSAVPIDNIPYTVQLRNSSGYIVCAGTLISPQHVVTAAHCFDDYEPTDITVVAGVKSNTDTGVQRAIEKLFKHDTYNPTTMHNDAAVIKLESPVEVSQNIGILGKLCSKALENKASIQANGWMSTEQNEVFTIVRFPILIKDACITDCKEAGVETDITSSMLCGDFNSRFYCTHNPGGPVINHLELCGIVVGGPACANPKFPGVVTSVYAVRDFIEKSITL